MREDGYMQKKKSILIGLFSGVMVFLFGFAMMYLMWITIGSTQGLPGLFFYRAATIGDGICLPILIGSATAFNQCNKEFYKYNRRLNLILALVVSLIAVIIQASWLIRDDTLLNWSIPIQHYFNIAGWYHSLFFIVIFGVVAYQLCGIWFVLRKRKTEFLWFEKAIYGLLVFAGTLFILMYVTDDYSQYLPEAILLSIVAAGIILVFMIYIKTTNRIRTKELLPAATMGIISAYSVSLMICLPIRGDILIALGGGLCVCFLWRVENSTVANLLIKDVLTIAVYTGGLYIISGLANVSEMICAFIFLSVFTMLLEYLYMGEMRNRCFSVIAVGIYTLLHSFFFENIKSLINVFQAAFMGVVVLFFQKEIQDYFSVLVAAEIKKNKSKIDEKAFQKIKCKVYLQITIGILAMAILLLHWLVDVLKDRGSRIETGVLNSLTGNIACVLFVGFFLLAIFGIKELRKHMLVKIVTILVSILTLGSIIMLIIVNVETLPVLEWTFVQWVMMFCSACACIGAAVLSAHGYYMNVVLLRGLQRKHMALTVAVIQFVGNLILNIAITVLLLSKQTKMSLLLILFVTIFAYTVLPVLHARVIRYEYQSSHVVGNSILGGIAQDGLTVGTIILFAICMPCLYISMMKKIDITTILGGLALICVAFSPVKFCISNNVKHMDQQRKVLRDYPNEEEMWNVLHKCLVRQSIQTIIAMFPYVCVIAGKEFMQILFKSKTWKEAIKELINTYIDKDEYGEEDKEEAHYAKKQG